MIRLSIIFNFLLLSSTSHAQPITQLSNSRLQYAPTFSCNEYGGSKLYSEFSDSSICFNYAFGFMLTDSKLPGPNESNLVSPQFLNLYGSNIPQEWIIHADEVLEHIYQSNNNDTYNLNDIPLAILTWPAIGNPYLINDEGEYYQINIDVASFVDADGDGMYNALQGDYPIVRIDGVFSLPSMFRFVAQISNDDLDQIDSQVLRTNMQYLIDCENQVLERTLFSHLEIVNIGDVVIPDVKIGIYGPEHIDCSQFEQLGVDSVANASYVYEREDDWCEDRDIYLPQGKEAMSYRVYLNKEISTFGVTYHNIAGVEADSLKYPAGEAQIINRLSGSWNDGTPYTYGGNGYNLGSNDITKYCFSGDPLDSESWTMSNEQIPHAQWGGITGFDYGDIPIGGIVSLDYAESVRVVDAVQYLDVFKNWTDELETIKDYYASGGNTELCESAVYTTCQIDCVYPGDVNNDGIVHASDIALLNVALDKGLVGPPRDKYSYAWTGYNVPDWDENLYDVNAKYYDVNGDGRVDRRDYYDLARVLKKSRVENYEVNLPPTEGTSAICLSLDYIALPDGGYWIYPVLEDSTDMAIPLKSLSFEIGFDDTKVSSSLDNPCIRYNENFAIVGNCTQDILQLENKNNATGYYFNTPPYDEYYEFPSVFDVLAGLTTGNPDGLLSTTLTIGNVLAIDESGKIVDLCTQDLELTLENIATTTEETIQVNKMDVFPNPSTDRVLISLPEIGKYQIHMIDTYGRLVKEQSIVNDSQVNIAVSDLATGVYFISIIDLSSQKQWIEKLIKN